MSTVFLEGVEFYAYHGVPAEERHIGHRYSMDLEFTLNSRALETDRVDDSVDYARAALKAIEVATAESHQTVERVSFLIGSALLEEFPICNSVRVRLRKLHPPAPVIATAAGVEILMTR